MKDGATKACVGMAAIAAVYIARIVTDPSADGILFGSVLAAIGGLAGYTVAAMTKKPS